MKVAAYMALHYGADYMAYAIKGVIDQVDQFYILYSQRPSYGHVGGLQCPESRDQLKAIAEGAAGNKLRWIDINHTMREGDHRNQIFHNLNPLPDVLAVVDSDEVWDPEAFSVALEYASKSTFFNIGAHHSGWHHFWRSFNEYCTDGFCPMRFNNLKVGRGTQEINCPSKIYHFGYVQRSEIMDYKWSIHGHQDELRKEWRYDIYENYQKGVTKELHPVAYGIWQETQPFDRNTLPSFMHTHPYFNRDVIR